MLRDVKFFEQSSGKLEENYKSGEAGGGVQGDDTVSLIKMTNAGIVCWATCRACETSIHVCTHILNLDNIIAFSNNATLLCESMHTAQETQTNTRKWMVNNQNEL